VILAGVLQHPRDYVRAGEHHFRLRSMFGEAIGLSFTGILLMFHILLGLAHPRVAAPGQAVRPSVMPWRETVLAPTGLILDANLLALVNQWILRTSR